MLRSELVSQVQAMLIQSKRFVCLCHSNPDGDAIGALLGMGLLLERHMPEKETLFFCKDKSPDTFSYLSSVHRIQHDPLILDGDAVIILDVAEPKLTGLHETHPMLFDPATSSINIDHHPTNINFATLNIINPDAASACEIVFDLAEALSWDLTPEIATCLLTGIYTDTGGLLHSNTSVRVYRTVAALLRAGARQQDIVTAVFRTAKLSTLKLWGRVLENISLTSEGGAVSAVTHSDFRATGAHYSELTGAIDYLNAVPGMRFSMILSERDGKVKGSIRTLREDIDVAAMAGKFHGGGHKKAAGFTLPGTLQPEVRWKVVDDEA